MTEAEQRALFNWSIEPPISEDEAFEILDANGVDEIKWDKSLNNNYMNWIYLHVK